ncbi:Hypothetical predicted protein, partial [Pelobates cultripes]
AYCIVGFDAKMLFQAELCVNWDLMRFILTHNHFIFQGKYYHQVRGTAMGTACAPSYANLHLGWWESTTVFNVNMEKYTRHIKLWKRYIDDVLIIWTDTAELFLEFVAILNLNNINLRLTNEGDLISTLFRIPIGQYLRLRRNCSNIEDFKIKARALQHQFKQKGYPNRCLKYAYKRALCEERWELLKDKSIPKLTQEIIRCIGNFDAGWNQIMDILDRFWPLLHQDIHLKKVITPRASVTARRGRNIKDILVPSHLKSTPQKNTWLKSTVLGTYQCGKCKACKFIRRPSKKFQDSLGQQEFLVKNFFNCQTMGIVYLLSCSCKKLYVGKTSRKFKLRIGEHVNSVNPKRLVDTPVSKHLKLHHGGSAEGIRFCGIEKVILGPRGGDLDKRLLQRESFWIYKLKTLSPLVLAHRWATQLDKSELNDVFAITYKREGQQDC